MSHVPRSILVNFAGTGLGVAVVLGVVPVYLAVLGPEAYGLVGLFATLSGASVALDFGLSFTLNRELARLSVASAADGEGSGLAFTLQAGCWAAGAAVGAATMLAAPHVAASWLTFSVLSTREVTEALTLTGAALPFVMTRNFYLAGLNGLQHQGLANVLQTGGLTARTAVTVLALRVAGPRVTVFFVAQLVMLGVETAVAAAGLWRALPAAARGARVRTTVMAQRVRFSAGVGGTMLLGLALTSMDQVILSRVLPLSEFGYYTIACTMAAALGYVVQPVTTAVYPRFSQLVERGDTPALTEAYHLYSQVVAVLVLPLGLLLACFPGEVLALWMRDAAVARDTGPVLGLRALGTSLNTLMHVPHVLQLAFGWSSLGAYANAVAVVLVAPAMVVLARWYGGVGAALAWVGLNVGYLVLAMARMHRHVLVGQGRRWYAGTLAPGAAVAVVVLASRAAMPPGLGAAATVGWMAATYVLAAAAALLAAPVARAEAVRLVAPGWTR